jgi:hypothetical protein
MQDCTHCTSCTNPINWLSIASDALAQTLEYLCKLFACYFELFV